MNASRKYLIIGAGATGLGAAWRLKELGSEDFLVLEESDHVGGLAASFVDDKGFTWDIGGHVLFSHYERFDRLMDKVLSASEWLNHEREAWAWMENRWVPYPVQLNIRHLSENTMRKCLDGMQAASTNKKEAAPRNLRDWVLASFGKGMADAFLLPYNSKVWAYPLEELSCQWIAERVAPIDVSRIINGIQLKRDDISWGPNRTFRFPKHGGTGQIWRNAAKEIGLRHFCLGVGAREINYGKKEVITSDGRVLGYEFILSTIPVDLLSGMLRPVLSDDLMACSRDLCHSSSNIIGIGLSGKPPEPLRTKCWMYFPESNCPFYRVTVFSNYSPHNVPDIEQYWSLITETSESRHKPVQQDRLVEDTIQGCLNTGLMEARNQIVSIWRHRKEYGYPIPTLKRDTALAKLLPELEISGVHSRGRFGAWKYEVGNQDHSFMQGVEWADRVTRNTPEKTMHGNVPTR